MPWIESGCAFCPNQANDELFFVEEERHVRADNTFSFKSLRFEAPRHLPDRAIHIRFQRSRPLERVVVYYKGERMGEARLLNAVANDRPPQSSGPAGTMPTASVTLSAVEEPHSSIPQSQIL